jgi:hypothetical protein
MSATHYKGRFVSCWRQSDDQYHLTISDGDGSGNVIELDQEHMLHVMSGNGTSIEFSVTNIAAPADAAAET